MSYMINNMYNIPTLRIPLYLFNFTRKHPRMPLFKPFFAILFEKRFWDGHLVFLTFQSPLI